MARRKASSADFIKFLSDGNVAAGDFVAISRSADNTVLKADGTDHEKMPAIGVAKALRSGSVIVQINHLYSLPSGHGLTLSYGDLLYIDPSSPGKATNSLPSSGNLQLVAEVKKVSGELLLRFEPNLITL